ncbi:biotin--[acetyl-CoA-carboxylase] ligase [bacterium]|nr:biotin--[acetyl-CoA-carboxylase] ligase [bacterium]
MRVPPAGHDTVGEGTFGREVHRFDEVPSTNDLAMDLAALGRSEGTVVIAGSQTRGKGRRGRRWFSPPGKNLYLSIILRPRRKRREWPELSWVVAGGVARFLAGAAMRGPVTLKCPNDVLVGGRKIAGILLENRMTPALPSGMVAGIGLNVNLREEDLPGEMKGLATSMAMETGGETDLGELLVRICGSVEVTYREWTLYGGQEVRRSLEEEWVVFAGFLENGTCSGMNLEGAGDGE